MVSKMLFEKALARGDGFAVASRECTEVFLAKFDKGCEDATIKQANWDPSKVRDKLKRDIEAEILSVRTTKLSELNEKYENKLNKALKEPVEALLETAGEDTWPAIRKLLNKETKVAVSGLESDLVAFELDQVTVDELLSKIEKYATSVVENKVREEAGQVLIRMKDRFSTLFSRDSDSMPRVWTGKEDIKAITKTACSASMKLLSTLAAIRLDEEKDSIENTLSLALVETSKTGALKDRGLDSLDPLASSTWEMVPNEKTLITPVQCKNLWRQFKSETEFAVTQAISAQEAHKKNNNWLPPPCAIGAMFILGFNEFMVLLRNPLWLAVIFIGYLVGKAMWVQLDITGDFRHGFLAGMLSLSTKFVPTVMNVLKKLAEEGQGPNVQNQQQRTDVKEEEEDWFVSN